MLRLVLFLRSKRNMGNLRGVESEGSVLIPEAAMRLGLSRRTVYYRIREGKLATIRTKCGSQRVLCRSIATLLLEEAERRAARRLRRRRRRSDAEPLALQVEPLP